MYFLLDSSRITFFCWINALLESSYTWNHKEPHSFYRIRGRYPSIAIYRGEPSIIFEGIFSFNIFSSLSSKTKNQDNDLHWHQWKKTVTKHIWFLLLLGVKNTKKIFFVHFLYTISKISLQRIIASYIQLYFKYKDSTMLPHHCGDPSLFSTNLWVPTLPLKLENISSIFSLEIIS